MQITTLEPGKEHAWDAFIEAHADGSLYQLSAWKNAVEGAYGGRSFYLLARESEQVIAALPLMLLSSPLFGKRMVSLPHAPLAGLCSASPTAAASLYEAACQLTQRFNARYLELRQQTPLELNIPLSQRYCLYTLHLPETPDKLWNSIAKEARNQVRKAEKSGITFHMGNDTADLQSFYSVYCEHMRDLGTPVHSQGFFKGVLTQFSGQARLFSVRWQGKTIGGMFVISHGNTLFNLWACSLKRYFKFCPNNLLYWGAMQQAILQGLTVFDFGRSTQGSGTEKFKLQWGAHSQPLYYYQWSPVGQSQPRSIQDEYGDGLLVRTWQHLPVSLTRLIGPWLRKGVA